MKLTVDNCQDCPFVNRDNEYLYDRCNLGDFYATIYELPRVYLPNDRVDDRCPLKKGKVTVRLK